jgi:hypothetical protein
MIADHAYSPGSLPFMDRRASLFYFAAGVPPSLGTVSVHWTTGWEKVSWPT